MRRLLPLFLILGCGQNRGFGGQDLGGDKVLSSDPIAENGGNTTSDTEDFTDTTNLEVMQDAYCADTGTPAPAAFELTGGTGTIGIVHGGTVEHCCADWRYDPVINGSMITISYTDVSESTCDCDCSWTFEYALTGLAAGNWTVNAAGDEDQVQVD